MQKKQKREEQTNELLQKQFKAIQDILNKEGIPDVVRAQLLDRYYDQMKELISNELYNKVLSNAALLFKLLEYLGCKDAKEYLSLSKSNWDVLNDFSEEMWNELINGIKAPEFARWGELRTQKVYYDINNNDWDRLRRANEDMLFVGQVTNAEIEYFLPADTRLVPVRVTMIDDTEGNFCELLEIGKGDTYRNVNSADKKVVIITSVDVSVTKNEDENFDYVSLQIVFSDADGKSFTTRLSNFLDAFTFVQASNEARTRIPLYSDRCTFDLSPPVWTDRYGITHSYGGYSYFYIPPELLFVDSIKYVKGDRVSANLERWLDDEAYKGEIVAVNKPDPTVKKGVKKVTYTIDFKDGNWEEGVKGSEIVYSDSKTYKLRKLATRWYVKCMYKHRIHDKGKWGNNILINPKTHDATLRDITSKLRVKYIASLIQYEKPDPEKEGFHMLIQEKEPDSWMNIFFNPKVIAEADMSGLFNLEKFKGKLAIFPDADLKIKLPYIETLGDKVFAGNTNLTSVHLKNVLHIGDEAFEGCPIVELHIPNVKRIGKKAFRNCEIKELRLENVSWIDDEAFEQVTTLTTLDLPKLYMLNERSFQHCPITYLHIPEVGSIFSWALTNIRVEKLYLPEVWKIYDDVFSEGSINFLPNTNVYDIHWPKIRNIGRNFLSGMRRGVVPLPYEFLLENPDAYLKGIVGKPVQWVDKFRNEVVCIQLECIWDNGTLTVFVKILDRYDRNDMQTYPVGNRPTFKVIYTITDIMEKYFGQKIVIGATLGSPRDVDVKYGIIKLEVTTERTKAINFRKDMCKLIGKDGACKIDEQTLITKIMSSKKQVNSTLSAWTAVMVYKGSGGSSSGVVLNKGMMMMSLKF